jgi:hypothetical protein
MSVELTSYGMYKMRAYACKSLKLDLSSSRTMEQFISTRFGGR